jgi:hypothetical protein
MANVNTPTGQRLSRRSTPPRCPSPTAASSGLNRRGFLGRTGTAAVLGAFAWLEAWPARAVPSGVVAGTPLPFGRPLVVKPLLVYHLDQPREKTSWRPTAVRHRDGPRM